VAAAKRVDQSVRFFFPAHNFPLSPLRIIVQNLSFEATTDELRAKFSPFGTIVDAIIAVEAGGRSRGFGFVTFDSPDAVTAIVAEGVVHELGGRVLRVQIANQKRGGGGGGGERGGERGDRRGPPREIKAQGPKLYCGDLPWELSADELAEHFGKFGKVVNAYLAEVQYAHSVNGYKPHRGFGFVEFATEEEATAALKAQHTIKGASVRTTSAKGEPKGDKDKRRKERPDRPNNNNAGGESTEEGKSGKRREGGGGGGSGKEKEKEREGGAPPKARTPPSDKQQGGSKQGSPKPAAAAAAPAPVAAPAKKTGGVKVAAAPKENPWSKKGGDAAGGDAAANTAEFPTLGDVASGKVKLRKKTEDEVAQEIAQERAREAKDKKFVEGKGKEEAE
jgi:RNA recognition motif-containing protein